MYSYIKTIFAVITFSLIISYGGTTSLADEPNQEYEKVTILFHQNVDLSIVPSNRITYHFDTIPAYSALLTAEEIKEIQDTPDIELINTEKTVSISSTQSVDWGYNMIGIPLIKSASLTGNKIKIAILDTGIDKAHQDLNVTGGKNFIENNSAYNDDNGHGTHVAGIIAALDNKKGTLGVAPDAKIYGLKFLDENGEGSTTDLANAIDWAIENKMDILNMSFGFSGSDPIISELLNKAYKENILIVGAAGNEGKNSISFPASNRNVIAVGAINKNRKLADFSNTGPQIEVTAPGVGVRSTYINNQYKTMDGTSMAAPYVSGYLALLKQKYPTKTNDEIRSLLSKNTLDLGFVGRDSDYGFGLIQSFISEEESVDTGKEASKNLPYFKVINEKVPVYDNRSGSLVIVGYLEKDQVYPIERHFTSWYQIRFGSYSAFIKRSDGLPVSSHTLKNISSSVKTSNRQFTALNDTPVYDNSSGSLIPFGTIKRGTSFSITSTYTSWIGVNFAGRVGYVSTNDIAIDFKSTDRYFKVIGKKIPVFDNRSGSLVIVGYLTKGETYSRKKDYTSWHEISFGDFSGFVRKVGTMPAESIHTKLASNKPFTGRYLTTKSDKVVYDNSSGKLIPFLTLKKGIKYPIVQTYTSWYEVNIAGRTGFVRR